MAEDKGMSDYFLEVGESDVDDTDVSDEITIEEEDDDDEVGNGRDGVGVHGSASFVTQQWPQSFSSNLDGKTPLLSDYQKGHWRQDIDRIFRKQSSLTDNSSLLRQLTGELPIGQRCSLVQTVFNCVNVMAGVGLLSTPYTVKEAGWSSLFVLVLFAFVCCYTATALKVEKES